ncbi:MAG TPA: hypothetical protein VGV59_17775 [Pyrinomonadaceae bacterium]|nr:hypothetical protein [Pyrinomonadaceae bacterium]
MNGKIRNILEQLMKKQGAISILRYRDAGDSTFELTTNLSDISHRTWLKYEFTGDMEMFRVEIRHRFGEINKNVDTLTAARQLFTMLHKNIGSYGTSTAYIGIELEGDKSYAALNSFHHFLTKWSDEDIAQALHLHFFDLATSMLMDDANLTILIRY